MKIYVYYYHDGKQFEYLWLLLSDGEQNECVGLLLSWLRTVWKLGAITIMMENSMKTWGYYYHDGEQYENLGLLLSLLRTVWKLGAITVIIKNNAVLEN